MENIGKFGEAMAIHQSFLSQIIQTAELANVFYYTMLQYIERAELIDLQIFLLTINAHYHTSHDTE